MWIVTGATGFIGSALVWELNQRGEKNLILADHIAPEKRPGSLRGRDFKKFILADDLFSELAKADWAKDIRGVYHMGACSTTTETDEAYLRRNNTEYTQKIWEFCTKMKIPMVNASSAACYGDGQKGFDDAGDSREFKPLNLYGWSKLNFDIWADRQTVTPPNWWNLRFFNVYGPNEYHKGDQASVVFKAFQQISEAGKLRLFKSHNPKYRDGEQLRDFVYVKDVTRWMVEIMNGRKVKSGVYNMGYGQARTWLDLAKNTFSNMGREMKIDWIEIPPNIRNQYQYFTEAKMDRLMAEGVSRPQWSLEKGIADYVNGYLSKKDPHL